MNMHHPGIFFSQPAVKPAAGRGATRAVVAVSHRLQVDAARLGILLLLAILMAGCAVLPPVVSGPDPEVIAKQQRTDRAKASLLEGLKSYEAGSYEESQKKLLIAMDSGVLTVPEQLNARKHLAFIQCVNNRETICREEFEKAFALDPGFELSPAEVGHPTWGPIYRLVRAELELKKSGRSLPPPPPVRQPTAGEKLMAEATKAYDEADYTKAIRLLQDASREPLPAADKINALKFTAFSYCLTNRMTLCRAEFEKILQSNPAFELAPAEAGHPSWGPSFRAVKAKQKKSAAKK